MNEYIQSERRYVEINRRLSNINSAAAGMITLLTIVAIWGQWTRIGIVFAVQLPVIAANIWINLVHLPRRGRSAEILRGIINLGSGLVLNEIAGWPLPVWLWLPFIALAFDHLDRRVASWMLIGTCVLQDSAALLSGVHWMYPLTFTGLAAYCWGISRMRYSIMRDLLTDSDRQRTAIEETHGLLHVAHVKLEAEAKARLQMEAEHRQSNKLEAVGRLASGVAHEINTPVQFVSDSIYFLRDATTDLWKVMEKLQLVRRAVLDGTPAAGAAKDATDAEEEADLEYLLENVPKAIERSLEGLGRVATIVRSMKEFAHPDAGEMTCVDLNRAVESTLTVARNEYKYVAEVETDFGELPPVTCHAGEINQVVLNIIVNAAHAIGDMVCNSGEKGLITIRTRHEGEYAVISITDTGAGIPEAIRERIFDPFFTTKEVGKGTGQGLAIARSVVMEKHGGMLSLESKVGEGTSFFIRLPIAGRAAGAMEEAAA